jgi:hypothetical protein
MSDGSSDGQVTYPVLGWGDAPAPVPERTVSLTYLTGTLKFEPGRWDIEPWTIEVEEPNWFFWTKKVTKRVWAVVPANEHAYVAISGIESYAEACNVRDMLEGRHYDA